MYRVAKQIDRNQTGVCLLRRDLGREYVRSWVTHKKEKVVKLVKLCSAFTLSRIQNHSDNQKLFFYMSYMKFKRIKPIPGHESVWDYPRPPAIEQVSEHLKVVFNGQEIANSNQSYRILETSHPPTYYMPLSAFIEGALVPTGKISFCEFKGEAIYYHIRSGNQTAEFAAWGYPNPNPRFAALKNHVSLYASSVEACFVGEEQVQAQSGDFYGGWITSKVVGPFKGGPGTWGW